MCIIWATEFGRYALQRGEVGEREAVEGRELFWRREDRKTGGECGALGKYRKNTPQKQLERKSGNTHEGLNKKYVPQNHW